MDICKKKRAAPAHAKLQTEVIKMIAVKEGINYPQAMKQLKGYIVKVLGGSHKDKGVKYIDALQQVKKYLSKGGLPPKSINKATYQKLTVNKSISKKEIQLKSASYLFANSSHINKKLSYEELLKKNQQLERENLILKNQLSFFKIRIFDSL